MFNDYKNINEDSFNDALMESIRAAIYDDEIEKIYIYRAAGGRLRDSNGKIYSGRLIMKDGSFFDENVYMILTEYSIQSIRRFIPSKTLNINLSGKSI